jgi:ribosomal protein S18 acetylase RimI-like enzyme
VENIYLRPITSAEFDKWKVHSIENYKKEKEKSGLTPEDAQIVAERSFKSLLPEGENSPNQFIYSVVEKASEEVIGTLWWGLQGEGKVKSPWIYDIELQESARGKGYGRATMLAAEKDIKGKGYNKLGLHVFGHNKVARGLYESLGFQTTNVVMSKDL